MPTMFRVTVGGITIEFILFTGRHENHWHAKYREEARVGKWSVAARIFAGQLLLVALITAAVSTVLFLDARQQSYDRTAQRMLSVSSAHSRQSVRPQGRPVAPRPQRRCSRMRRPSGATPRWISSPSWLRMAPVSPIPTRSRSGASTSAASTPRCGASRQPRSCGRAGTLDQGHRPGQGRGRIGQGPGRRRRDRHQCVRGGECAPALRRPHRRGPSGPASAASWLLSRPAPGHPRLGSRTALQYLRLLRFAAAFGA